MKATFTQQEILLMTGTNFSSRQCSKKDDDDNQANLTEKEQLEEACWSGMLQEMLPEIYEQPAENRKLYLWQIREASSFLGLELGEQPGDKESHLSIDPYTFMPGLLLS